MATLDIESSCPYSVVKGLGEKLFWVFSCIIDCRLVWLVKACTGMLDELLLGPECVP